VNKAFVASDAILNLQERVRLSSQVHVVGSRSKTGYHHPSHSSIEVGSHELSGVVAYDPQEFIVTVQAGTSVTELTALLRDHGQYLPFDPMLSQRGATLGGTVASNLAGPCRFRFGGIRDFVIGVRFVDGLGNLLRGGGQVVKNAAGFDFPKLMVGSAGRFGLMYELTFKVFPRPERFSTLIVPIHDLQHAMEMISSLASGPFDLEAIDMVPVCKSGQTMLTERLDVAGKSYELAIRVGGLADAIPGRVDRLLSHVGDARVLAPTEEEGYWNAASNLDDLWHHDFILKLPLTPERMPKVEQLCDRHALLRRYSVAGTVAWIAMSASVSAHAFVELSAIGRCQVIRGQCEHQADKWKGSLGPFGLAVKRALDPHHKFI
jgi:glycolate oxidase FAD binding subunit